MRLIELRLRDFRGVVDTTVTFSDGITIVEGPNESGKSSLPEALRLLREYKDSSVAAEIRAIQPVDRDVGPEAQVELRTGAYRLTYRKRWLKGRLTELVVHEPTPAQFTGARAHDRFRQILEATVDMDLLAALEVVQGRSLEQAQVADLSALHQALDRASQTAQTQGDTVDGSDALPGGDRESTDAGDLLTRIRKEYTQYFTAGGKPTGGYARAIQELDTRQQALVELEDSSTAMDRLEADHAAVAHTIDTLEERLTRARREHTTLQDEYASLLELRASLQRAESELGTAQERRDRAAQTVTSRRALAAAVHERDHQRARTGEQLAGDRAALAEATEALRTRQRDTDLAEEALATARGRARAARRALDRHGAASEVADLQQRLDTIAAARRDRSAAAAATEAISVDADTVADLVALDTDLRVARASRASAAASVTVRTTGQVPVQIDGTPLDGAEQVSQRVLEPVTITVPDIATVVIDPGIAPAEIDRAVRDAQEALERALRTAAVDSIDQARDLADQAEAARQRFDTATARLAQALSDQTEDELQQRLAQAQLHLGAEPAGADADPPPSTAQLRAAADAADSGMERAEQQLSVARSELAAAQRAHAEAQNRCSISATTAEAAQAEYQRQIDQLARERAQLADSAAEEVLEGATADLQRMQLEVAAATDDLTAAEPDIVRMRLHNAADLVTGTRDEVEAQRTRLAELRGELGHYTQQGLYDQRLRAAAARDETAAAHQRWERAAAAAQLLNDTMQRHYEQAQRRYVAPFTDAIEHLGRAVFGSDFRITIDDELRIVSRTLQGRTVPFESLSAGTREQISLLGRLACAQLVAEDGGAPVILDDALGFADPQRLADLQSVLHTVGRTSQVVLLTCQPERFARLGGASRVSLAG